MLDLRPGEDEPSDAATRALVLAFLLSLQAEEDRPLVYVHLPAVDADTTDLDLAGTMAGAPDGIMLGRCGSARDVQHLGAKLAVQEAEHDLDDGVTAVIADAGSAAASLFGLGSYATAGDRLMGLAWDAQALASDLGCEPVCEADRPFPGPLATARAMTLIGARAAGIAALDGPALVLSDDDLRAECLLARRDGFNAKLAVSAEQVSIINEIFDRDLR